MSNDKPAATWHPGTGPTPRGAADDFTPTASQVRSVYAVAVDPPKFAEREARFDRWLAEHDREVAARTCAILQRLRGGDIEQEYIDHAISAAGEQP